VKQNGMQLYKPNFCAENNETWPYCLSV